MDKPKLPAVPRDEKGRILKGHSLNPTGKSPYMVTLATGERVSVNDMYKRDSLLALEVLKDLMLNEKAPAATRFNAAKYITDRAWGAPKATVQVTDERTDDTNVIDIKSMSTEALKALVGAKLIQLEAEIVPEDDDAE